MFHFGYIYIYIYIYIYTHIWQPAKVLAAKDGNLHSGFGDLFGLEFPPNFFVLGDLTSSRLSILGLDFFNRSLQFHLEYLHFLSCFVLSGVTYWAPLEIVLSHILFIDNCKWNQLFQICWPCLTREWNIVFRFIIVYSSLTDFGPY